MNKKYVFALVVLLGVTAFSLYKFSFLYIRQANNKPIKAEVTSLDVKKKSDATARPLAIDISVDKVPTGKIEKKDFIPQSQAEESMQKINTKLNEIFTNRESPQALVDYFEEEKLQPEMSKTSNEYTGTMMMIRTQKSIPGVRYFHAQYMGDDPEHTFLQHFSYEFRPSSNSMERSIQSAEGTFSLSNKKIYREGDFITYDIGEDGQYELSIEKADWESLKNDPYNAHSKDDVGTVITRIELKIHDKEDHDHIEAQDHQ